MEPEPILLGDLVHDPDLEYHVKVGKIVHRLRESSWVKSMPEEELIHRHLDELERCGRLHDPVGVSIELAAIMDEARYFRVPVYTTIIVPRSDTL